MIEVMYGKQADETKDAEREKLQKADYSNESAGTWKLPKNIRQIGTANGEKRIYIEDYVVTYLNYIAKPGSVQARGAVLLGEKKKTDFGDIILINGAVAAQNIEFDMDESEFTKEAWKQIYDDAKQYFPDLSVVGWFLSRMGFSVSVNEKIEKMHVENFPGRDKVLYITDSMEGEDAFYMFNHGGLERQNGYYIYYTRNEAMQNYIINQKGGASNDDNTEIQRKDEELVKNYRNRNESKQKYHVEHVSFAYVASSFLVLVLLAMGITVVSNYDKMKQLEVSINRLELTAGAEEDYVPAMAEDMGVTDSETFSNELTAEDTSVGVDDMTTEIMSRGESIYYTGGSDAPESDITTEQSLSEYNGDEEITYTIKYGDSLISISTAIYGSSYYAEAIARANNMEVDDPIYEGQVIVLPVIHNVE